MRDDTPTTARAEGLRIGLAVSRYHREITDALRAGAVERFGQLGGRDEDLLVAEAPGSFELTALCRVFAVRGDVDAIVALGCVIAGETTHDQHICAAVSHGLSAVIVETGVPIAFGVLTCQTFEQARERAGGAKGNKGAEAMDAAIATACEIDRIGQSIDSRRTS